MMSSLDDRDLALDPAGHLRHLGLVVAGARLVQDREVPLEHLGRTDGHLGPAGVGRDRDDAFACRPLSRKYWANSCSAVMWSTGIVKKPWIWPACRSIVSTRSAPAICEHVRHELAR